jgi:hypothetical protein
MEQARLHLFIGVEANPTIPTVRQARGQRQLELASRRLLALALVQPQLDLMKLSLAHDP